MTKEDLINKHPYIFQNYNKRSEDINSPFAWFGIECGVGWLDLIDELCTTLDELYPEQVIAAQVKEKFGTLRFYIDYKGKSWGDVHKLISEYENKSEFICERCGEEGKLRSGSWLRCLCETCYNAKNNI